MLIPELNWNKINGLIPAIIQDADSSMVLMLGYMNKEALELTINTKQVTFYSRTKQKLWIKGETSGNYLKLVEIKIDCDNDSLLILTKPNGPTCHLETTSCFQQLTGKISFLTELEQYLIVRKQQDPSISYTASLFTQGIKRIAQKVGEEGVETALAAVTNNKAELVEEAADLLYHLIVLLLSQDLSINNIIDVLQQRHQTNN